MKRLPITDADVARPPQSDRGGLVPRGFFLKSGTVKLYQGDVLEVLRTLPSGTFHCVVTSPPYYGLRDYGTAQWSGGDADCDHVAGSNYGSMSDNSNKGAIRGGPFRDTCGKCGATRIDAQIGLEASPDEYIATMVAVFREVRRVLRPDGTCWVNMGDSYASSSSNNGGYSDKSTLAGFSNPATKGRIAYDSTVPHRINHGAKPKDLLMMPARVALALQADGWWLRSDIIWSKPNPMPESVTDRPTSSHEHVFLLTKSARYFYDAEAVKEDSVDPEGSAKRYEAPFFTGPKHKSGGYSGIGKTHTVGMMQFNGSRNLRNVWTIVTAPYAEAHFATFPPELAERCIKAGTSEHGCCAVCGAPWVRLVERPPIPDAAFDKARMSDDLNVKASPLHRSGKASGQKMQKWLDENPWKTIGWAPSCKHNAAVVPCTVLDPFSGSGTTGLVVGLHARHATLIELGADYVQMARKRILKKEVPVVLMSPKIAPRIMRVRAKNRRGA